jgi:two-component system phosphate regulon sensor histidine kinase PhoR
MLRSLLFWKFYTGCVFLVVLTTAVVGILIARQLEQSYLAETEENLQARAQLLGEIFLHSSEDEPETFEKLVRKLGGEIKSRLTIIRADGVVLADSEEDPVRMGNHLSRPEIAEAGKRGVGSDTRRSSTLGVNMMYVAAVVKDGGGVRGFARAAIPLTALDEQLSHIRKMVILVAMFAVTAALALGFFFARRITRPIVHITKAAESFADGNYDLKVKTKAGGEIGKLAVAFNRMSEQLHERMETITKDKNEVIAILGGMVDGVVAIDREGRIVHINEIAADVLRAAPGESVGKRMDEAIQIPAILEILRAAIASPGGLTREVQLSEKSKGRIIEVRASVLRGVSNEPAGLVVVLHDITELRRLEQVRRDFVANVSHELKTPLTAIRGQIETLIDDPEMGAETHRRFLLKARDQTARLSNLVTDLLTISRVESGEGAVEKETLDLREPVQASARSLFPAAETKGLSPLLQIPDEPVPIHGDVEAARQIVDNLLDNAIKYTPAGGGVKVRLRIEKSEAVIEVEDTGPGIEQKHLERIFERFYRVDKARSRELGGTGLGLSIVKHLTSAMNGHVTLDSTPGKGSTFRVHFPLISAR